MSQYDLPTTDDLIYYVINSVVEDNITHKSLVENSIYLTKYYCWR